MLEIFIKSKYVDLNDIENPIKDYRFQKEDYYDWNRAGAILIKIRHNEVYLEDSLFSLFEASPVSFNSVSEVEILKGPASEGFGGFFIRIEVDPVVNQYKRQVLTLLEVTGVLGGMFEIFEITCGIIIGLFSSMVFKNELTKELRNANDRALKVAKEFDKLKQRLENIENLQGRNDEESKIPNINLRRKRRNRDILDIYQDQAKPEVELKIKKSDELDIFEKELDSIDLVYEIKMLKEQVAYLLDKDVSFIKLKETNPN